MGGALAVRSFRGDRQSPTLAAVLPFHARGPRALSLVCFNMAEPGEEGPMGSGTAPKPAGLVEAVKAIPNLGFMEGPFVALAEKFESALTSALSGKATPDDVKAAVSEAVSGLRTELTRALKATSDSAAQRMGAVEESVGAAERNVRDVAETLTTVAEATHKTASALEQLQALAFALQKTLEDGLAGKATPDDVKAAVSEAVSGLRTELTRALKATSDSASTRMGGIEERLAAAESATETAARAASQAQSTADGRATPEQVTAAVEAAVKPLLERVAAVETANAELRAALDERPTKKDVLAIVKKVVQSALRTAAKLVGVEEETEPEAK